jgi:carbohydrate kinase (thermoresistant glucokinase family)
MGVSAAGKSSVASALSTRLRAPWIDADHLHPAPNVEKMASGIPLDDEDRWPWLDLIGARLAAQEDVVVACSALRRIYRDRLRAARPDAVFVHLTADRVVLASRAAARDDHFMPPSLLDSQLSILEPLESDERGVVIDVELPLTEVVDQAADWITRYV